MGSYVITPTLSDFGARRSEITDRIEAVQNTYSTGNKYRHQELFINDAIDNNAPENVSSVWYNSKKQVYQMVTSQSGGTATLLEIDSDKKWAFSKAITNHPKVLGVCFSWVYSEKLDRFYGLTAGLGEYDGDFNPISNSYALASGSDSMAYDTKRDFVLVAGQKFVVGGHWLIQLDPNGEQVEEAGVYGFQMARNYLVSIGTGRTMKFLNYSEYNDRYYYADENKIIEVHPETGSANILLTKGTDVIGLMIEKGSQYGYYAYVDGTNVKLTKFDLSNYSVSYPEISLGNIDEFVFLYVGKTVVINCQKNSINSGAWYSVSYNSELTLNLTFEKYLFYNDTGATSLPSKVKYNTSTSPISSKKYLKMNTSQIFKLSTEDKVDLHIPVYIGVVSGPYSTTTMLNVNPVTAYPVVTDTTVTDCCLDELKCEINIKLAKKSCEATNRAIVGRHYGCMFEDAQLLEAMLWITTFDCLTCDEIENLRCITSKI